jgi:hypothetical protein
MKTVVFWDVALCSLVHTDQYLPDDTVQDPSRQSRSIAIGWESYETHKYTVGKMLLLIIKAAGTYSYNWVLKG